MKERNNETDEIQEEFNNGAEMNEEIREIPGFEGYYVSDQGRMLSIRKTKSGETKIRPLSIDKEKMTVRLRKDNKTISFKIARLVAEAFLPEPSDGRKRVKHKDGNPLNNRVSNLRWEGLTRREVKEIRNMLNGDYTMGEISRKFNINRTHIKRIRDFEIWKEVR